MTHCYVATHGKVYCNYSLPEGFLKFLKACLKFLKAYLKFLKACLKFLKACLKFLKFLKFLKASLLAPERHKGSLVPPERP